MREERKIHPQTKVSGDQRAKTRFDSVSILYLILIGILFLILYQYAYDKKIFRVGDEPAYYITGCALAEGKGYTNIHLPNNPSANHFPPGYPAIISLLIALFGEELQGIKMLNGVFLIGAIVLFFLIVKSVTQNKHVAFFTSLVVLLNSHVLFYSSLVMSEIPFTFFLLFSIWLFIKTFSKGSALSHAYIWLFIISVVITFYIKSLGVVIIGASTLILFLNKRWLQALALILVFTLSYAPWYARSVSLGGNSYAKQLQMINPYQPALGNMSLSDYPDRFLKNLDRYVSKEISSAVFGHSIYDYAPQPDLKDYLFGIVLLLLIGTGIFSLKEYRWFFCLLTGGVFFILMLWPAVWTGIRFMLPLVPLFIFFIIQGIQFAASKLLRSLTAQNKYVAYAPLVLLIPIFPAWKENLQLLNKDARAPYASNYASYFDLAAWCKKSLPDSAVIATRKPELFFMQAHRKALGYAYTEDDKALISNLQKQGVTHVVLDNLGNSSTELYLVPALRNNTEKFKAIKKGGEKTFLFEICYDCGYVGEMRNGKKNGKGKVKYPDGSSYEGNWTDDKKNGSGRYNWPDGSYFIGTFSFDKREGAGAIYNPDGTFIKGEWKNDERVNSEAKLQKQ